MIPVSKPIINKKSAKKKLNEAIQTGWISSQGPFVEKFEKTFSQFVGTKYAIATNSGTSALHLALCALDIKPGDQVIVPAFTMIAAVLPIIYLQATPILVDVDPQTGNINPEEIESKISKKTKAIVVVHLNGHPADMNKVLKIAKKYNLKVIEDAAESHGAKCYVDGNFKNVGNVGDIGCFSLYANKIITSGEGGIVATNNEFLASKVKSLQNLARTPGRHFFHQEVAFTYRLSNIQAALGLAQLELASKIIAKKRKIFKYYTSKLKILDSLVLPVEKDYAKRLCWQYEIRLKDANKRDSLIKYLAKAGVETREFFTPIHLQPAFLKEGFFKKERYPASENLAKSGIYLPSGPNILMKDMDKICTHIKAFLLK